MSGQIYKVSVYVEGKTEQIVLPVLLAPLLAIKLQKGIAIEFNPKDSKARLLAQVPSQASLSLCNDPALIVIAMPDLQPKNIEFPHQTANELINGLNERFDNAVRKLSAKKAIDSADVKSRFKVFCFKYNLEVLLLAAHEQLAAYLKLAAPLPPLPKPAEDINNEKPPSVVVNELFKKYLNRNYNKVDDARRILEVASYKIVADRCSQQFKPFVDFLENL